ncbi:TRAP transporter permease [Halalkalibacillus sediminis]|uniref:TRAP transporter permease n=1 Tax=Halalkalibacillus sediminis TaxID=2018042 RepID=UPI0013902E2C|nr:TRAP transporter fused permease subunit [Halalkalibacillus sediminis]
MINNTHHIPRKPLEANDSEFEKPTGSLRLLIAFVLGIFTLYQIYSTIFLPPPPHIQRSLHLGFALFLIYLLIPVKFYHQQKFSLKASIVLLNIALAGLSVVVGIYWAIYYKELISKGIFLESLDLLIGGIAVLLVIEASRRIFGWTMVYVVTAFLIYAIIGDYLPGIFHHGGLNVDTLIRIMFFTTDGMLGLPIKVASTDIFLFFIFTAFLLKVGVGDYFIRLADTITSRTTGGEAKSAILSSMFMGTLSWSSTSNVIKSGSHSIPSMIKKGYKREFASSVEAAASTGSQIMPPVLGASAFIIVEWIGGVTLAEVFKASLIPSLLFFLSVFIIIHLQVKKMGVSDTGEHDAMGSMQLLKKSYVLAPLIVFFILLLLEQPIVEVMMISIFATIIVGFINDLVDHNRAFGLKEMVVACIDGARNALTVIIALAVVGIIVGITVQTGLANKLSNGISFITQDLTLLTLFITMVLSIILGMGMPAAAKYVLVAALAAPIITLTGEPSIGAHLFVFYFALYSDIMSPAALASYTSARISGATPTQTSIFASKIVLPALTIPYLFIIYPELLFIEPANPLSILWVLLTVIVGLTALCIGAVGYYKVEFSSKERLASIVIGLLLIYPHVISNVVGIGLLVFFIVYLKRKYSTMDITG